MLSTRSVVTQFVLLTSPLGLVNLVIKFKARGSLYLEKGDLQGGISKTLAPNISEKAMSRSFAEIAPICNA